MSGGVDSSVTAALLAEAGYEVVGVTLQLYDHGAAAGRKGACCAGRDIHDARRPWPSGSASPTTCSTSRRASGRGDRRFRHGAMPRAARRSLASAATSGSSSATCSRSHASSAPMRWRPATMPAASPGRHGPELHRAADPAKDQSYFLFATTADAARVPALPAGRARQGRDPRPCAAPRASTVADKPDSQDICFVPTGHYSDVVARLRPDAFEPGEIVHVDGRVLGAHDGHRPFHGRPAARPRRSPTASGSTWSASSPRTRRVVVGPAQAATVRRDRARRGQLAGRRRRPAQACRSRSSTATTSPRSRPASRLLPDGRASVALASAAAGRRPRSGLRLLRRHPPARRRLDRAGTRRWAGTGRPAQRLTAPAPALDDAGRARPPGQMRVAE